MRIITTAIKLYKTKSWHSNILHYEDNLFKTFKAYEEVDDACCFYQVSFKINTNCFKAGELIDRVEVSNENNRIELYDMDKHETKPVEVLIIDSGDLHHACAI